MDDLMEGVRKARELAGGAQLRPSLEAYLVRLGERTGALRRARGWSQQQFAAAAGLHRTYVNAVEQGKQNVTIGAAVRMAEALGIRLEELLGEWSGPAEL
jgi:ribosome-binding protein aMBF1 (putative translation factor)